MTRNFWVVIGLSALSLLLFALLLYGYWDLPGKLVVGITIAAALVTALVIFVIIRFLIYREIEHIYDLLHHVKRREYLLSAQKTGNRNNPIHKIKVEIADFALRKQEEINELKKLETFRREFLADVSHELKTPIFAAQGFIHTLIDGAVDDTKVRDKFLSKAANSLDGLHVLVQDLITISQMEIGEIKMHFQHFDLRRLTEELYDQLEEMAARKNTTLLINRYSPKSCYVYADKMRIGQVMINLISNAIKYGKDGGMVLTSFTLENDFFDISVKDDGPGIEEKHLSRIFERFYRVEKSRAKDHGGSGLGLAIVKHIVEAHYSKVLVESRSGEGTQFSFRLKAGKVINDQSIIRDTKE